MANYTRPELQTMAAQAAQRHGVPVDAFLRMIHTESAWDPNAVNPRSGAAGLGQFMPGTAKAYGLTDPFDPGANLDASARYLSDLIRGHGGNQGAALLTYSGWAKQIPAYLAGQPINPKAAAYVNGILGGGRSEATPVPAGAPEGSNTPPDETPISRGPLVDSPEIDLSPFIGTPPSWKNGRPPVPDAPNPPREAQGTPGEIDLSPFIGNPPSARGVPGGLASLLAKALAAIPPTGPAQGGTPPTAGPASTPAPGGIDLSPFIGNPPSTR